MKHGLYAVLAVTVGGVASLLFMPPMQTSSGNIAAFLAVVVVFFIAFMPYHAARGEAQGRIYMRGWVDQREQPLKFKLAIFMCYAWEALMAAMFVSILRYFLK